MKPETIRSTGKGRSLNRLKTGDKEIYLKGEKE